MCGEVVAAPPSLQDTVYPILRKKSLHFCEKSKKFLKLCTALRKKYKMKRLRSRACSDGQRARPLRLLTAFASTSPKGRGLGTEIKFAATTPPVKIAFVAARRPQQTRNKNILSAVHGQSKAEAIQNRPAIRKDAEKNQSYYKRSSP